MVARVRKGDTVVVLAGKDKGKQGAVIDIATRSGKVVVKDVAIVKRHKKARRAGEKAGIKAEESFIDITKVMPICSSCKKPCRVNSKELEGGKKSRMCNRCKEIF